jgi:MFS superfamily sulfate permease-like transporter
MREAVRGAPTAARWLVLDAESIAHIDTTAEEALGRLVGELHDDVVSLVVARMRTELKDRLDDVGLGEQIGAERFYFTVQAAVQACVSEKTGNQHDRA